MPQTTLPSMNVRQAASRFGVVQRKDRATLTSRILLQNWQVVLHRKCFIVGIVDEVIAFGLAQTLLATPQYTATSRIEIGSDPKRGTTVKGLESQNAGQDLEFLLIQYLLLQARGLAERVLRQRSK